MTVKARVGPLMQPSTKDQCSAATLHDIPRELRQWIDAEVWFANRQFTTSPTDYRAEATLQNGASTTVLAGVHKPTGQQVAIKAVRKSANCAILQRARVQREVAIHKRVSGHPNVVELHGAFEDAHHYYLVMEKIDDELLSIVSATDGDLGEDCAREIFRQALLGLQHCHGHNVLHADIKPENLLVDRRVHDYITGEMEPGLVKICDFGLSEEMPPTPSKLCTRLKGSLQYLSLEAVALGALPLSPRTDLWALGVTLYSLVAGSMPYQVEGTSLLSLYKSMNRTDRDVAQVVGLTKELQDLFRRMLHHHIPTMNRPTGPEIMAHPWVMDRQPIILDELN